MPKALVAAAVLLALTLPWTARGRADLDGARELGEVHWLRDFEAAAADARASGRPRFVLFQEVPGCSTCVGFGETVLSHPLLVEAIETEFVPVAVLNNAPGPDRAILERYAEPAWNNPVVRFLDPEGGDLIPRAAGIWSPHGIATRMREALVAAGRPVPAYLEAAVTELSPRRSARWVFATHCFWEGEACAGALPGVLSTEAGWLAGSEVVEVGFDPARTEPAELLRRLAAAGCASRVYASDAAELALARSVFGERAELAPARPRRAREADQKRHLRRSALAGLTLTPLQRTRVNAALARGRDPSPWLSPRQRRQLAERG